MKKDAQEAPEVVHDNSEEEEEMSDPVKTVLIHMLIGQKPELPLKKDLKGEKVDKLNEKLMSFKKLAQRKACVWSTFVLLQQEHIPIIYVGIGLIHMVLQTHGSGGHWGEADGWAHFWKWPCRFVHANVRVWFLRWVDPWLIHQHAYYESMILVFIDMVQLILQ